MTSINTTGSRPIERVDVSTHEVVAHQRVLCDLTETAAVFAIRQRRQHGRVHEHCAGLVERAHEVLALGEVHAGLSADGAVDHREKCGGHLHDVDTAVVHRRDEPGSVADYPAADGEHEVAAQ